MCFLCVMCFDGVIVCVWLFVFIVKILCVPVGVSDLVFQCVSGCD